MLKEFVLQAAHHNRPFSMDVRWKSDEGYAPLILFVHGFKGFKDWGHFNLMADYFRDLGYVFAKLNLSHNGTSPEHPIDYVDLEAFANNNFSIELGDVDAALSFLLTTEQLPKRLFNPQRIFLIGHSRGGGLALLHAGEDERIAAVATLAAISDLAKRWPSSFIEDWRQKGTQYIPNNRTGQMMPLHFQLVEDVLNNPERLSIPHKVQQMRQPLLLIHGTQDETLPHSMAEELANWHYAAELLLIEGANHTLGGAHPWEGTELPVHTRMACDRIHDFFQRI
jgi:uncharacterized protein